ncbi:GMC oxidoreductase [Parahaliea mediterranea]|uniref:GMC family oxidoreductase n=1 Tax=Parahaliea mediterranea TaxID=651086 RepID=A0A939DCM1_9GAMM|nr:GMC family oxidoreductase [Parahaliea mediterranea]MBN7795579.1 GMC family oxidoreductase [Parahaliea mediterranea]
MVGTANASAKSYDLVIVGAGAAGSVVAAVAAEAGKRVLILEAGPERELGQLYSSQIWARKLKWSGAPVTEEGNLRVGHNFNAGFGTGGAALHHYAVWPRLHENDFSVHSDYGVGLDWPIGYADLRPFYDRIQAQVGISGDARAETWRPPGEPYPMPPLPVFSQGEVIRRGFEALEMHTAPIPVAVNSTPSGERRACLYDGWCDAGCPIGALANPLVTYLPRALKAGAEIRHRAEVLRVLHDASGRRVTAVEYVDAAGARQQARGDQVVLAAFAVQTARLLLNSRSDQHPAGLGNHNDRVGRYLMTHPATTISGLFKEETQPALGITGGQLICHDRYADKRPAPERFGSYQWLIANAVKPNDLLGIANSRPDLVGAALEPFMQRAARHYGTMVAVGEDIALADNRVSLSRQRDAHGMPLAHCTHNIGEQTAAMTRAATEEGLAIFRAAGAEEAWAGPTAGMHILGGTVMGRDSATSVTDSYGRCHELDNLFIAGPGVFPSSGAVNPTFTVHALALRTAEHLLQK